MWPLTALAALLWWTLARRWSTLQRGSRLPLATLVQQARGGSLTPRGIIDQAVLSATQVAPLRPTIQSQLDVLHQELRAGAPLAGSLIAVAPLCGLLGTVSGMIETFDSLASMAMFSRSGGIAGGIAEALVSTQMGLSVAIPGALVHKALVGRQRRLEQELDELTELLLGQSHKEAA